MLQARDVCVANSSTAHAAAAQVCSRAGRVLPARGGDRAGSAGVESDSRLERLAAVSRGGDRGRSARREVVLFHAGGRPAAVAVCAGPVSHVSPAAAGERRTARALLFAFGSAAAGLLPGDDQADCRAGWIGPACRRAAAAASFTTACKWATCSTCARRPARFLIDPLADGADRADRRRHRRHAAGEHAGGDRPRRAAARCLRAVWLSQRRASIRSRSDWRRLARSNPQSAPARELFGAAARATCCTRITTIAAG